MVQSEKLQELPILQNLLSPEKQDAYSRFLKKACTQQNAKTLCITLPVSYEDPLRWFYHHHSKYPFHFYWETPSQFSAIAALGSSRSLTFRGPNRFQNLENALHEADSEIINYHYRVLKRIKNQGGLAGFPFS